MYHHILTIKILVKNTVTSPQKEIGQLFRIGHF